MRIVIGGAGLYALSYFSSFQSEKKGNSTKGPIKASFSEWKQSDIFLNPVEK